MLPLVIAILSICVGVKVGKSVRSGLMIGVGFVGLGLIVDMMNAQLGPAAQAMSENFGLSMSVVDIGWPGSFSNDMGIKHSDSGDTSSNSC